jgi:hypothetical protein
MQLHEISSSRLQMCVFCSPTSRHGRRSQRPLPFWNDTSRKLLVAVREYANGDCGLLAVNLRDER